MTFRYARHTDDLHKIEKFYTEIAGLEKTGFFENHDHYNGIFLGHKNSDWQLEFTVSADKPNHIFDEDDILVFYLNSQAEMEIVKKKIKQQGLEVKIPVNPYWLHNGIMISDPDGYGVVFSIRHLNFISDDEFTNCIKTTPVSNWSELIDFVKKIPYGRNESRFDFSLVLKEHKGTCSSKHAFLKKIADLNHFDNVELILCMYKMYEANTPKIGNVLSEQGLEYLPEAHCYLKLNNQRVDITSENANADNLGNDILEEMVITPEQVITYKVDYHKNFMKKWIEENKIQRTFEEIWDLREECIKKLS
jgi:hypothetical protein